MTQTTINLIMEPPDSQTSQPRKEIIKQSSARIWRNLADERHLRKFNFLEDTLEIKYEDKIITWYNLEILCFNFQVELSYW